MNTLDVAVIGLTRDDILAMKIADAVSFHHYEGKGRIGLTLRAERGGEQRIFTATEQRLLPLVNEWERRRDVTVASTVSGYTEDTFWHGTDTSSGFALAHGGYTEPELRTIVDLLRPADELTLEFMGDRFSTGNTRPLGIHVDVLRLVVRRTGTPAMTFLLDASACRENSARMVKR